MGGLKGDFISFSFNGVHSSELGITRTSDGSRYNENLLPTIQDKTVQVPGADGTYFFGSFYTQRPFNVPIAFDSLTEAEYRKLRQHFGDKGIHELIFDERPYKVYMAKSTGTPQLKTICFDGEDKDGNPCRIYKGEGTLTFTAYYPFARSRFKYLEDYTSANIPEWDNWPGEAEGGDLYKPGILGEVSIGNLEEWRIESGIKAEGTFDWDEANIYNGGDFDTECKIFAKFADGSIQGMITLENEENLEVGHLELREIVKKQNDAGICINSKTNLISGIDDNGKETGTLYNEYVSKGDFFKIPVGEFLLNVPFKYTIEYDYIYY